MTRFVIDAPTLLRIVDEDVHLDPDARLVAPSALRSEALELLLRQVRDGTRTEKAALDAHERMTAVKVRLLGDRVSRGTAWRIARAQGWDTLHDAEYLAVARLQADALVTTDPRLAAAAEGSVRVAPFGELLAADQAT